MPCYMCEAILSSSMALTKHMINKHPELGVAYPCAQCTLCDHISLLTSNLKKHIEFKHPDFYNKNFNEIKKGNISKGPYPGARKSFALTVEVGNKNIFRSLTEQECEEYLNCGYYNDLCKVKIKNNQVRLTHIERHKLLNSHRLDSKTQKSQAQPSLQSSKDHDVQLPTPKPAVQHVAVKTNKKYMIRCNLEGCHAEFYKEKAFQEHKQEHTDEEAVTGTITFLPVNTTDSEAESSSEGDKRINHELPNAKRQRTVEE